MIQRQRVQVQETDGPVQLRSPGVPGDTFTGAPQAPIDNNLTRIADALSGFNSALLQFGSVAAKQAKEQRVADETARVEGRLAQMSPQQVLDYRKSPDYLPVLDPHARGVEAGVYGQSHAQVIRSQIDTGIANGTIKLDDPNFNPTQMLQGYASGVVDDINARYANDPVSRKLAMENFRRTYDGYYQTYSQQAMKARSEQIMTANMGYARQFLDTALTGAVDGKLNNDSLSKTWSSVTTELGPKGSANIPSKAMKGIKLDLLENAAADPKKVAFVEPLLKSQQLDADGKTLLPALWDDASVAEKVMQIKQTAKKTLAKNWSNNANTAMEDAAFEALRRQDGSGAAVQPRRERNPVNGDWETVGTGAQENAAKRYFTWSQNDAMTQQRNPQIVLDREIAVAQHANIPIPHVKQMLDDSASRVLDGSFTNNFQNRQQLLGAYQTWQGLVRNNRSWTESKMELSENTKEFFSAMDVATGPMHLDADQALDFAAGIVRNPMGKEDPDRLKRKMVDIEKELSVLIYDGGFLRSVFDNDTPYNQTFVMHRVEQVAKMIGKNSQVPTDQAIKLAKEFVSKNTFQVNGSALAAVPNMSTDDARKYMTAKIDEMLPDIQKRFDYKGLKKGDVAIFDRGDGTYGLRDKRSSLEIRLPTRAADGTEWRGEVRITPQELQDMKRRDEVLTRERIKSENAINSKQSLIDAHDVLDRRQKVLDNGALGGAYGQVEQNKIWEERSKLPPRPEADPLPPRLTAKERRAQRRALREGGQD